MIGLFACDSRGEPSPPAAAERDADPPPAEADASPETQRVADETPESAESAEPAAPEDERIVREGELVYTELPRTKSVEAYMGVEFTLKGEGDGEPLVLAASEAVSRETLVRHHGARVRVECTPEAPIPPDPDSAYPIDMDGAPLPRPSKCVVSQLTAL